LCRLPTGLVVGIRPICSHRLASSVAMPVSWLRNSAFSCCWARTNPRPATGVASQSASELPTGVLIFTGGLCLRYNRGSSCRQGFSRAEVRRKPLRPLKRYSASLCNKQFVSSFTFNVYILFEVPCVTAEFAFNRRIVSFPVAIRAC